MVHANICVPTSVPVQINVFLPQVLDSDAVFEMKVVNFDRVVSNLYGSPQWQLTYATHVSNYLQELPRRIAVVGGGQYILLIALSTHVCSAKTNTIQLKGDRKLRFSLWMTFYRIHRNRICGNFPELWSEGALLTLAPVNLLNRTALTFSLQTKNPPSQTYKLSTKSVYS